LDERAELGVDVVRGVDQDLAVEWARGLKNVLDCFRVNR
jgi:hypothetical protein